MHPRCKPPRCKHPQMQESPGVLDTRAGLSDSDPPMLNFDALRRATLSRDPFDHVVVDDFLPAIAAPAVATDFPTIKSTGSFPLSELSYGPAFAELMDELNGAEFEKDLGGMFG